ncbi:MAG: porin family protein [Cyclobacteriaceae bacterium]
MKKVILVLLLLMSYQAWSQLSYQIQAGVSLVDMATVNRPEIDGMIFNDEDKLSRVSYLIGVNTQLDMKFLYLKSGLIYSRRGMTQEIIQKDVIQLDYLGIPLLLGKRIFKNFSLEAGPEINYLIHYKYDDNFEDWDFGLQAGVVYQLFEKINAKAHYYHGLSNTSQFIKNGSIAPKGMKLQNRMIALSVGYTL